MSKCSVFQVRCLPLNAAVPVPRQIAPMKYKRYYSASSELLGSVYVTGGDNVSNCHALPLVERCAYPQKHNYFLSFINRIISLPKMRTKIGPHNHGMG